MDIDVDKYIIEERFTDKKSCGITTKLLNRLQVEAENAEKLPLVVINIDEKQKKQRWKLTITIEKEEI